MTGERPTAQVATLALLALAGSAAAQAPSPGHTYAEGQLFYLLAKSATEVAKR